MKDKTKYQICQEYSLVDNYGAADITAMEAMQVYTEQETEKVLKNIIDDIDFGYNAQMIKGKILNGSYR